MSPPAPPIRPCTAAEEGIWFEEQMRVGDSNTGFFSVTMRGPLDPARVRAACEALVAAHPALRSLVHLEEDRPMIMERPVGEPLLFELADLPCGIGEEAAATRAWREAHGKRKWDLTREPPLIFYHLLHDGERSTLLIVAHHMCFDGRSKFVFAREFISTLSGRPPQPRPALLGAGDVTAAGDAAAGFWDGLDVPAMPGLRLFPAMPPGEPATVVSTDPFVIDGVGGLRALAEAGGTTLFGGVLAGVAALLHNHGNEHIVLCIPADTSLPEERDRIGLAVNAVPIYMHMPPGATFATALEAARLALIQVKRFRRVPLRRYWVGRRWAGAARSLFSKISVSYQRMPLDIPQLPGGRITTEWDFVAPNTAQTFDLMVQLRDRREDVLGRIDHRLDRIGGEAAHRFAAELRETIRLGMAAPDAPLADYPCPPADSVVDGGAALPDAAEIGEVAPGWAVAVMANGRILPRGLPGRLVLRRHSDGELVETPHVGVCEPDGRLRWIGAQDDIAVFAGLTTSAARLRRVLLVHPDVAEAEVRFEDDRYVAVVTPRPSAAPDPLALRAYLRRNAEPGEHRPARVEVRC